MKLRDRRLNLVIVDDIHNVISDEQAKTLEGVKIKTLSEVDIYKIISLIPTDERITLYRYDGANINGVYSPAEYTVIKQTEEGYWFNYYGGAKWTSRIATRRFAYPTKKEAMVSYKKRKQRQILLLERQLSNAKEQYREAKRALDLELFEDNSNQLI